MHMNIYCVENFLLHMKISNHVGVYVKFPFYLRNFCCIFVFFVQFLARVTTQKLNNKDKYATKISQVERKFNIYPSQGC